MGVLIDMIKSDSKGSSIPKYFKDNTQMMYNKYRKPDDTVKSIPIKNMAEGRFYFLIYKDESNWMQYSPIFFTDYKKFDNKIIAYGVNMNFLPLDIRSGFFDQFINNLEDNYQLKSVTFEGTYKQLIKVGWEYSLVEYDLSRLVQVYEIDIQILCNFLYSTYPKVKYNPEKLYDIWKKKLSTKEARHQEMITQLSTDFYKVTDEIREKYDELSNHLKRVERNNKKFG